MGLFTKKRKDAEYIRPKDTIQAIVPFIMKGKCVSEVSSRVEFDITDLLQKSPEEVRALYDQSFKKEENIYEI